jgi:CheY-like chemotaxis protein
VAERTDARVEDVAAPPHANQAVIAVSGEATREVLIRELTLRGYAPRVQSFAALEGGLPNAACLFLDIGDLVRSGRRPAGAGRIIALAAVGDPALEGRGTAFADGVLRRPLVQNELRLMLDQLGRGEPLDGCIHRAVERESLPQFAHAHVLVADDSEVNREVACEALKRLGIHRIAVVGDGLAAFNAAIETKFDLVLMDGSMPELDGFESARRIRAHEKENAATPTPIIALTAHVAGAGADAWRESGMDAVLHKPFSVKKLAECIGAFVQPSAAENVGEIAETVEPKNQSAPQPQENTALLDSETIERLLQTARSGREFIDRILSLYQSHAPHVLADLRAAAERSDYIAAAAAAHSLKSMSLNMGAAGLAARLASVEDAARNGGRLPSGNVLEGLGTLLEATIAELLGTFVINEPAKLSASSSR